MTGLRPRSSTWPPEAACGSSTGPSHAIDVATAGLGGRVVVAFDTLAGTATAYAAGPNAADGRLDALGLGHDSRDLAYRSPPGASPAGTPIRLRARTFHADATGVTLHVADDVTHRSSDTPMSLAASGVLLRGAAAGRAGHLRLVGGDHHAARPDHAPLPVRRRDGVDARLPRRRRAPRRRPRAVSRIGGRYRPGRHGVHVPGTQPIPWLDGAVVYQVFPDRFRNGDRPTTARKHEAPRYGWPPDASDRSVRRPWGARPDTATASREWFGGDLAGITAEP